MRYAGAHGRSVRRHVSSAWPELTTIDPVGEKQNELKPRTPRGFFLVSAEGAAV
jgi:hypothetical protein